MFRRLLYILVCCLLVFVSSAQQNSVLNSGKWFKVSVENDGIYKINYTDFNAMNLSENIISINTIKLYGNGGGMLPNLNSEARYSDLQENAIFIEDINNNDIFDSEDFILFYGQSTDTWKYNSSSNLFEHQNHFFSDENYYFLTVDESLSISSGKRVSNKNLVGFFDLTINTFNDYQFHEEDKESLIQSGSRWFGERFEIQNTYSFNYNFPNLKNNIPVFIKASVAARSINSSTFSIQANSDYLNSIGVSNIIYQYASEYAKSTDATRSFLSDNDVIEITINYSSPENNAIGWLDYLELNVTRDLIMTNDFMLFRYSNLSNDLTAQYEISNANSNTIIWDITDPINIQKMQTSYMNSKLMFNDSINILKQYCMFNGNNFNSPNFVGLINNQNLQAVSSNVQYVIISHPNFLNAANRLAIFHKENDDLISIVVTPQQIYNEFSSGVEDVTAIRDFIKMLYDRDNASIEYVLLMGDGSYDHKNRISPNHNFIPTFQSSNSLHPTLSYVTDDYFTLLDIDDGDFNNDIVDICLGRLPVISLNQANQVVDKIEAYYDERSLGDWRNNITFVADDGDNGTPPDGNLHMRDADKLAENLDTSFANLNFKKIYLDNFLQESTPGGPRSPQTQNAINQSIEKGTFLINYTGHGGPLGWTKERILEIDQIQNWDNLYKLPLFMTATCKFSNFDDPEKTSAGELALLNPKGGAIALLTTTRLVYSAPNYTLNKNFVSVFYEKNNGQFPTLGQLFKKTKVLSGSNMNTRNFTLLGDPALRLSYPEYNISSTTNIDTMKALEEVIVSGEILDNNGLLMNNFNGIVYPTVFDKEVVSLTLGQESCTPMPYRNQDNIIYKGLATVNSGQFTFSFVVPKDIENNFANGKISYYAKSDDGDDASGHDDSFLIGGLSDNINYDFEGPSLSLFMNNRNFLDGGITNSSPSLLVDIEDLNGVNTVGNGIGHDIIAYLDNNTSEPINLNDYYTSEIDNYKKGEVLFPFQDLDLGEHKITIKVWDVFNNSSQQSLSFNVVEDDNIIISNFKCYPNPVSSSAEFFFEYNKSENISDFSFEIFSTTGQLIRTINKNMFIDGYRIGPIIWDGKNSYGNSLSPGIYIVKLNISSEDGMLSSESIPIAITPNY
jgi:hypothetical protein